MGRLLKKLLGITALEEQVRALSEKVKTLEEERSAGGTGVSAKQLLNEYLYGENGDE